MQNRYQGLKYVGGATAIYSGVGQVGYTVFLFAFFGTIGADMSVLVKGEQLLPLIQQYGGHFRALGYWDILIYFLPLLPTALALFAVYWAATPGRAMVGTSMSALYVGLGSVGSSIWMVVPALLAEKYAFATDAAQRAALAAASDAVNALVYGGIWNGVNMFFYGAWILLVGWSALSAGGLPRWLAWLSVVLGFFSILNFAGTALGLRVIQVAVLNVVFVLSAAWAIAVGVWLWRAGARETAPA